MDSDSEHNGLAFGMLLARRFDGIPHYHFAPPPTGRSGPTPRHGSRRRKQKMMVGKKEKRLKRVRKKGTPKAERVWHETLSTTEKSLTGNRPWLDFFERYS